PCSAICITKERTVVTSFGTKVHVFTKWSHTEAENEIHKPETIAEKAARLHRKLPNYHPRLLTDLLTSGRFSLVRFILIHVAKSLKEYAARVEKEDDEPLHISSIPITHILEEEKKTSKRKTLLDQFGSD